jgi:CheY-like chemotaxis protein
MRAALEEALARYAAFAEAADADSPVAAVLAAAPDLVVLVGDAARAHATILPKLAANALTATIPVALLSPEGLDVRLSAARFGVTLVPRTASADEMARQISLLAREERPAQSGGAVGEGTLDELLDILRRELQGGILSVSQEGGRSARFVLRPGRNVETAIRDFVKRIKPLVKESKPLHYELDDPGTGKLAVLDDDSDDGDRAILVGRRVLLVEDDAATADALAQELRAQGATVAVATSVGGGLERARSLDPEVVLVDEAALDGEGYAVLRTIRRDLGLRWASILVARLRDLLPAESAPRMDRLAGSLAPLLASDREIAELASKGQRFEARLESCGPSRLLRALAKSGRTLHVVVRHPRVVVELDVAEGLVAGADATPMGDAARRASGTTAVAALLAIGSGRVTVEPREAPSSANLLMPVADVFFAAVKETPPIRPSLPPITSTTPRPESSMPPPALLGELRRVLDKLREQGLGDLTSEHDLDSIEVARPPRRKSTLVGMPAPVTPPSEPPSSMAPSEAPSGGAHDSGLPPLSEVPTSSLATGAPRVPAPRVPTVTPPVVVPPPKLAATRRVPPVAPKVARAVPKSTPPPVAIAASATKVASVPPPPPVAATAASAKVASVPPPTPAAARPSRPPASVASAPVNAGMPASAVVESPSVVAGAAAPAPPPNPFAATMPIASAVAIPSVVTTAPWPTSEAPATSGTPAPVPPSAGFESFAEASTTARDLRGDVVTATESLDAFDLDTLAEPQSAADPADLGDKSPAIPSAYAPLDDTPFELARKPRWPWIAGAVALVAVVAVVAVILLRDEEPTPVAALGAAGAESTTEAAPENAGTGTVSGATGTESGTMAPDVVPTPTVTPTEAVEAENAETATGIEAATGTETETETGTETDSETETESAAEPSEAAELRENASPRERNDRLDELVSSGNFFRGRAQWDRARRSYEAALRMAPRNGPALAGLAKVALAQRRAPEAVRLSRTLVEVNARTAGNHVLLGDALSAAGDRAGARQAWEQALRINARHPTARARLGR